MSSARGPGMRESIRAGMTLWGRLRRKTFSRIPCPCTLAQPSDRWLTLLLSCLWQRDARECVLRTQVTVVSCGNVSDQNSSVLLDIITCGSLCRVKRERCQCLCVYYGIQSFQRLPLHFNVLKVFSMHKCHNNSSNRPVWLHCRSPSAGTLPDQHCSPDTLRQQLKMLWKLKHTSHARSNLFENPTGSTSLSFLSLSSVKHQQFCCTGGKGLQNHAKQSK